jgi:hypothetical protein
MALKINDITNVNIAYVANTLAKQPSTPTLRQTLASLERLNNASSMVLDRGWVAKSDNSGKVIYFIRLVPTSTTHIAYRPPHDGPGRGIILYFETLAELEASFQT